MGGLEEDTEVLEMKAKGQETTYPFVVIWDMLRRFKVQQWAARTLPNSDIFERTFLVRERVIIIRQRPKTGQHAVTSLTWRLAMLTVDYYWKFLLAPFLKLVLQHNIEFLTLTATYNKYILLVLYRCYCVYVYVYVLLRLQRRLG